MSGGEETMNCEELCTCDYLSAYFETNEVYGNSVSSNSTYLEM